jgi:hypothetical protein
MKNAYAVLDQKEKELARVRQEVESLRLVAPLLSEESTPDNPVQWPSDEPNRHRASLSDKRKS